MNILLISNNYIVIKDGQCWCDPNFYYILKRFSYMGEISLAALPKKDDPTYIQLDFIPQERIHFIEKTRIFPKAANTRILEELVKQNDLIIGYNPCVNAESALRLAKKHNKKYMTYLVACVWDSLWNHSYTGMISAPYRFLKVRQVTRQSDYVLYVTHEFLQRRYPNKKLNLGCSDVHIEPITPEITEKRIERISQLDLSKDVIKIATTAAVYVKYKGQRFVIKALGELKKKGKENFHYYMLGAGNPAALINVAKECGVEDKITFLGQVPHSKVGSVLDEMDVYLQPSLQEGLPRSVVEAMSRGMLCIGARTGAIPELLPEEFIVERKSVKQIADKLEALDLDTMRSACHQNIKTAGEYEIDKLKSRRDKFFDAIINDMKK